MTEIDASANVKRPFLRSEDAFYQTSTDDNSIKVVLCHQSASDSIAYVEHPSPFGGGDHMIERSDLP